MTRDQLMSALDGLFAYDTGSIGSGIHDEVLRKQAQSHLARMTSREVTQLVRDMWFSDEAMDAGYTYEDGAEFCRWLVDWMHL